LLNWGKNDLLRRTRHASFILISFCLLNSEKDLNPADTATTAEQRILCSRP